MNVRVAFAGIVLAALVTSLSACAALSSSTGTSIDASDKVRCERDGLFWHANLGICESI